MASHAALASSGIQTTPSGGSLSLHWTSNSKVDVRRMARGSSKSGKQDGKCNLDGSRSPINTPRAWSSGSIQSGPCTTMFSSRNNSRAASRTAGHRGSVIRMLQGRRGQVLKDGFADPLAWALATSCLHARRSRCKIPNGPTNEVCGCYGGWRRQLPDV